jgi:hypothetical protein
MSKLNAHSARPRHKKSPLHVEQLEDRNLLSTFLVLDYTPDRIPTESVRAASFSSGFNIRTRGGYAPGFLDFNNNGVVSNADVNLAAREIANRTADYFSGFDVQVVFGDVRRNTNMGQRLLFEGQTGPDPVYVVYVGGSSFDRDPSVFGVAFQAPVGYNNEFYAHTFFANMVRWYVRNDPRATPEDFAQDVATTVAHEFGHLLGLGHVAGNPVGDPNPMNYTADPNTAYFPDAWDSQTELKDVWLNSFYGYQNPAQELLDSFAGQPAFDTDGLTYTSGEGEPDRLRAGEMVGHARHRKHESELDEIVRALSWQHRKTDPGLKQALDAVHALWV